MRYEMIPDADTHNLERKSSISQHKGMLAVRKRNELCPLVYDVIDGIDCGKVYSHKAALSDGSHIGYTFPVGTCRYVSEIYLMGQENRKVKKRLPEWFGIGFYDEHVVRDVFVNTDKDSLGLEQERTLRIGKDYVLPIDMLEAAD